MFRHLRVLGLTVSLSAAIVLIGCAGADNANSRLDTGSGPLDGDTASDSATTGLDSSEPDAAPEWFRLGATLTLEDGLATQVDVRLEFLDGDHLPVGCTEDRSSLGVVASIETPDPTVYHWFRVSLAEPVTDCVDAAQVPAELFLGLGDLHPEVEAQLLGLDLDGVSDSLYGAYVLLDETQAELDAPDQVALAYGYAGTETDLSGEATARTAAPLPDGDYTLAGVYLFPLVSAQ